MSTWSVPTTRSLGVRRLLLRATAVQSNLGDFLGNLFLSEHGLAGTSERANESFRGG
jgi:hypothetical protein